MWPSTTYAAPGSGGPGDPGTGNVNLIVIVNDVTNNAPLQGATVAAVNPDGSQNNVITNSAGTSRFVVPNASTIHLTVQKSGYYHASKAITTSAFGPDSTRFELVPITVAATSTVTPTLTDASGNVVVTVLPGCEGDPNSDACYAAQDRAMMNDVRGWMKILIPLFGICIAFYLVSGMGKR